VAYEANARFEYPDTNGDASFFLASSHSCGEVLLATSRRIRHNRSTSTRSISVPKNTEEKTETKTKAKTMTKAAGKPKAPKKEYTVTKKRSGRYAVVGKGGKPINAEAKVEILVKEGILKKQEKKAKPAEAKTE